MKRLHVHVSVTDLDASVRFYSQLFATDPTVRKPDHAKWMLEDPQGVQWEAFLTTGESTVYGTDETRPKVEKAHSACCEPGRCGSSPG